MRSIGNDIAAERSPSGLCVVGWGEEKVTVEKLAVGRWTTDFLIHEVRRLWSPGDPLGVDCPFEFPRAFQEMAERRRHGLSPVEGDTQFRLTEQLILAAALRRPLSSVSSLITDTVVSRCYPLRHALLGDRCTDLVGYSTGIHEVYPAAALAAWGISVDAEKVDGKPVPSYKRPGKKGEGERARIVDALRGLTSSWLTISTEHLALLCKHDDAIDALVSALVARIAASAGQPTGPRTHPEVTEDQMETIEMEGWIHVPRLGSLENLPADFPMP